MAGDEHGAVAALDAAFGGNPEPAVAFSAPGRVNLIGGHTDYNDGFVLPAAIDRRTTVAARPRDDDRLRVYAERFDEVRTVARSELRPPGAGTWVDYVAGVAWAFREAGHDLTGADVAVAGEVPVGAGLASSAALELAAAATLAAGTGTEVDPVDLATLSRRAENEYVGVSCGLMDQFTAAVGQRDHAVFLDCRTRAYEHIPLDAGDVRLVVTDTNIEHELVDSAYNRRVEQCRAGVEAFDAALDREVTALRDVGVDDLDDPGVDLDETVARRCEHVVRENDRVRRARDALRAGDLAAVGDLMCRSHESLRDRYEVSCAELDAAVAAATDHDAVYGARMTGAGFGGCAVGLVAPDGVDDAVDAIAGGYRQRTGIDPDVHVFAPGDGLARER